MWATWSNGTRTMSRDKAGASWMKVTDEERYSLSGV